MTNEKTVKNTHTGKWGFAKKAMGVALIGATLIGIAGCAGTQYAADNAALQTQVSELQAKVTTFDANIKRGDLVWKEDIPQVDVTSDNKDAIKNAINGTEGLKFDETTGKVTLIAPPVVVPEVVLVEGFVSDDFALGDSVVMTLDHNDLEKLWKGKVSYDDEEYRAKEVVEFTSDMKVCFSGSPDCSNSFGPLAYLTTQAKASVKRAVKFSDVPDWSTVSLNNPLELDFMGQKLTVINYNGGLLTYLAGDEMWFVPNVAQEVNGKKVTVNAVTDDAVWVSVDNVTSKVSLGRENKINGLRLYLKDVINRNSLAECSAYMIVGEDAVKTVETGDGFDADEASDATWVWDLSENRIGIKHNKILNEADEAYKSGDSLVFPDGLTVTFDVADEAREKLTVSFDEIELEDVSVKVLALRTGSKDGLSYLYEEDRDETNELFWKDGAFLVWNKDDRAYVAVTGLKLAESGMEIGSDLALDGIDFDVNLGNRKFTSLSIGETDLSNRDEDTLTMFGTILSGVDDLDDAKELVFSVPEDAVKAKLRVA